MPTIAQSALTQERVNLFTQGYHPVPVNGKSPVLKDWSNVCLSADEADIESWGASHSWAASTGVVHDGLVMALDVDIDDLATMRLLHPVILRHLPGARVRIGKSPKAAYFFRADGALKGAGTSVPLRWTAGGSRYQVEVRGLGGQTVVHGIHPDTGKPYGWPHGELPEVDRLPVLQEGGLLDLLRELRDVLDARGGITWGKARMPAAASGSAPTTSGIGVSADAVFIEALLGVLLNPDLDWDDWFDVLLAVKGALTAEPDGGYDLFETWSAKASLHDPVGCLRWWNSITPNGSKGVGSLIYRVKKKGLWNPELQQHLDSALTASRTPAQAQFSPIPGGTTPAQAKACAAPVLPAGSLQPVLDGVALPGPRPRLYGNHVLRGAVTLLGGHGGVSKTNLALTEAAAMAAGKQLLWDKIWFPAGLKVAHLNRDEVQEEITRRMLGIVSHYGLTRQDVSGVLAMGRDVIPPEFALVRGDESPAPCQKSMDWLVDVLLRWDAKVLQLDPLVSFCSGERNSHFVALNHAWSQIQKRTGVSGYVVHHLRKGVPGEEAESSDDADSLRGGGALVDLARTVRVLRHMSKAQADTVGVTDPGLRRRLVSVNRSAKENYYLSAFDLSWYRLESVGIGNASAPWPEDEIGVPVPWALDALGGLSLSEQTAVLSSLKAGCGQNGQGRWSVHPQAGVRHVRELAGQLGLDPDAVFRQVMGWLKDGVLTDKATGCDDSGRPRKGLDVIKNPIPDEFS